MKISSLCIQSQFILVCDTSAKLVAKVKIRLALAKQVFIGGPEVLTVLRRLAATGEVRGTSRNRASVAGGVMG